MTQSYEKGKIYKIVNKNDPEEFYIGSTKNHLRLRWQQHKCDAKRKHGQLIYQRMNEIGFDSFQIVLIEDYPCNTKDELRKREDYFIGQLKPKLNKYRAYLTEDEKREYQKNSCKNWREKNKEKCDEHNKRYYLENKKHNKRYYLENKDKCDEYQRRYDLENKDTITLKKKEKVQCKICHSIVRKISMTRHKRTKKCQSAMVDTPTPALQGIADTSVADQTVLCGSVEEVTDEDGETIEIELID